MATDSLKEISGLATDAYAILLVMDHDLTFLTGSTPSSAFPQLLHDILGEPLTWHTPQFSLVLLW